MKSYELSIVLRRNDKSVLLDDMAAVEKLLDERRAMRLKGPQPSDAIKAAERLLSDLDEAA